MRENMTDIIRSNPLKDTTLNDLFRQTSLGDHASSIANTFYGHNHRNTVLALNPDTDGYGYLFFTRPELNMTLDNIRAVRRLVPFATALPTSIPRAVRIYLDPRVSMLENISSPLVNNESAFITLLDNAAISCSGWPDESISLETSDPDMYKGTFSWVNGGIDNAHSFTINAEFRNLPGDPITSLFMAWSTSMSEMRRGGPTGLVPYPDHMAYNEMNYNTGIWRIVTDKSKNFVTKLAKTIGVPLNGVRGSSFDFDRSKHINDSNKTISQSFGCDGFRSMDPILVYEFNKLVGTFKPPMQEDNLYIDYGSGYAKNPSSGMTEIERPYLNYFNHKGYPRIDPKSWRISWWIESDMYEDVMKIQIRTAAAVRSFNK